MMLIRFCRFLLYISAKFDLDLLSFLPCSIDAGIPERWQTF